MNKKILSKLKNIFNSTHFYFIVILLFVVVFWIFDFANNGISYENLNTKTVDQIKIKEENKIISIISPIDKVAYDKKMNELANNPPDKIVYKTVKTVIGKDKKGKDIIKTEKVPLDPQPIQIHLWPVKTPYPNAGALLPFNRIVAYYGNLYSKKMGVLGEYEENEMLRRLNLEVEKWKNADPSTPVIPALHYIAVVAQGDAGPDKDYASRMPFSEIDKVIKMATKINAIVFLDVQVGFSNMQREIPLLEKYLKMPQVHLGIDPEFSMKNGIRPGKIVGTVDATDVNYVANYLAKIVKENNLPPKILIVHRYTQKMVTNYKEIKLLPEVQIVMDMDGWGGGAKKINTYQQFIYKEPVQFTGFKLFYKNDILAPSTSMLTPKELLKLNPIPSYIQYQ